MCCDQESICKQNTFNTTRDLIEGVNYVLCLSSLDKLEMEINLLLFISQCVSDVVDVILCGVSSISFICWHFD